MVEYGISCGLVIYCLYCWDMFPRDFIINGHWILSKVFSVEMITWFLFFHSFMWCITFDWFANIQQLLYPWDRSQLTMVNNPFNVLVNFFLIFCWGFLFAPLFISDIGLKFFFCGALVWFWYPGDAVFVVLISVSPINIKFINICCLYLHVHRLGVFMFTVIYSCWLDLVSIM